MYTLYEYLDINFSYGSIYLNGSIIGYTDENGHFRVELPDRSQRVTLRFADEIFVGFYDKIQTVNFARGASGTFYETVIMTRRAPPIVIDSTIENTIESSVLNLSIIIPPNSIYNADGTLFTVKLSPKCRERYYLRAASVILFVFEQYPFVNFMNIIYSPKT